MTPEWLREHLLTELFRQLLPNILLEQESNIEKRYQLYKTSSDFMFVPIYVDTDDVNCSQVLNTQWLWLPCTVADIGFNNPAEMVNKLAMFTEIDPKILRAIATNLHISRNYFRLVMILDAGARAIDGDVVLYGKKRKGDEYKLLSAHLSPQLTPHLIA